jgi:hypothetical protein
MKSRSTIEAPMSEAPMSVINESPTVGNIGIVVEDDVVAVPVGIPVVPPPTEAGVKADPKA